MLTIVLAAPAIVIVTVSACSSSGGTTHGGSSGGSGGNGTGGSSTGGGGGTTALDGATSSTGGSAGRGATDAGAGVLCDPNYREGFGKNATGGAGRTTYTVTSPAATGTGSFAAAFSGDHAANVNIVFAVDTVAIPNALYIDHDVTIDGVANGQNGVTFDLPDDVQRALIVADPASNIVIRGLNFRGYGAPNSGVVENDLLALDGTNGSTISNVLIDRCTFYQAADGALDITGKVSDATVQRCLFYGNSHTMLIKYDTRKNISLHHNVFTHNGERNPQIKGDVQLIDFVNNVVHLNDVSAYPDGTAVSAYGVRIWSANSGSDSPGDVIGNFAASVFLGAGAEFDIQVDTGATLAGVYIDQTGNYCNPSSNCATTTKATPNAIPAGFEVTTLRATDLKADLLPCVGAPNRTTRDQQAIDDLAAVLP